MAFDRCSCLEGSARGSSILEYLCLTSMTVLKFVLSTIIAFGHYLGYAPENSDPIYLWRKPLHQVCRPTYHNLAETSVCALIHMLSTLGWFEQEVLLNTWQVVGLMEPHQILKTNSTTISMFTWCFGLIFSTCTTIINNNQDNLTDTSTNLFSLPLLQIHWQGSQCSRKQWENPRSSPARLCKQSVAAAA